MHGGHKLEAFLEPVFKQSNEHILTSKHTLSHQTEYLLMAVSVVASLAALVFALFKFRNYSRTGAENTGLAKVLENKWYVDDLYRNVVTRPLQSLSLFFNNIIERKGIDGLVNGAGRAVNYGSRQMRWVQSGQVGAYVLLMVLGILVLLVIQLFL
jgi:NADH-quinone oxidoreductase subunit L